MTDKLKIGISACFFHADAARPIFSGKTLQYIEQSIAHWVASQGALPVMIPSPEGATSRGTVALADYAAWLDGLVLMGGSDVWPGSYGEEPIKPQWSGDRIRDEYEAALTRTFVAAGKPVFGVCRGLQLLNVAFGGTLLQDIGTQQPQSQVHRDAVIRQHSTRQVEAVARHDPSRRVDIEELAAAVGEDLAIRAGLPAGEPMARVSLACASSTSTTPPARPAMAWSTARTTWRANGSAPATA